MNIITFKNVKKFGFTVIEILLGLSIFAIIAVSLYGVLRSGLLIQRKAQDFQEVQQEALRAFNRLQQDLENMVPYDFSGSEIDEQPFSGNHNSLSFILPSETGLKMVRYSTFTPQLGIIQTTEIGQTSKKNIPIVTNKEIEERIEYLIREEVPFIQYFQNGFNNNPEIEILLIGLKKESFQFSYLLANQDSKIQNEPQEETWVQQWEEGGLPVGIKVEMTLVNFSRNIKELSVQRKILIPRVAW